MSRSASKARSLTYAELDALANRYAHWSESIGIRRGEVVALLMPNRLEYLPIWYGLSKVGVATAPDQQPPHRRCAGALP
ncbi:MAG: AMP-binding protein [Caulobacteraceae bacterium]